MPSNLKRFLSLFPLWPLLLGVVMGVCVADNIGIDWWIVVSITGLLVMFGFRKLQVSLIILGFILGHGSHGLVIDHQQKWLDAIHSEYQILRTELKGVIIDTGPRRDGPYLIKVSDAGDLPSGVKVLFSTGSREHTPLEYGDMIELNGLLRVIDPMRNPYGFDRARWLHRKGADLSVTAYEPITVHGVSPLRWPVRIMSNWRHHLRKKMTEGLGTESSEAQLIRAVVLGERPPKPSRMIDDFRNSGTLHVFAVSGLHVGMVGTIFGSLLWFFQAPRWVFISGIVLAMTIYAGITGLRPPAVRAVLMSSIFLAGFLLRRRPSLINSLAASAIVVLLWDGHQFFTAGFQLSYGVLLTLALAAGFWIKILKPMAEIDPFMPRILLTPWQERILSVRKWIRNSLSVSLAAWMGSAPLMGIHFGIVTPIAILAGIPLMLLVFLVLALAMLGIAAGSMWSPLGKAVNNANAIVAKTTYNTAAMFARVPGGHWYLPPHRPEKGRIIVFDIPYGGAANFIDIGGGIMLDCGRSDHFNRYVLPTLTELKARPDSLIISHAESKHSGGMNDNLASFRPTQAIIPRRDLLSPSFRDFLKKAESLDCQLIVPHGGQIFPIEAGVYLEILHAPVELEGDGLADDTGLVIRLHWHGWRILFTGDAGYMTESRLLDAGIDLTSDVIIMGRNSDDYTGGEQFYRAVTPRAIISSNCDFPKPERIPESWTELTRKLGIIVFDQQKSGAVTLALKGDTLVLTPVLSTAKQHVIHR